MGDVHDNRSHKHTIAAASPISAAHVSALRILEATTLSESASLIASAFRESLGADAAYVALSAPEMAGSEEEFEALSIRAVAGDHRLVRRVGTQVNGGLEEEAADRSELTHLPSPMTAAGLIGRTPTMASLHAVLAPLPGRGVAVVLLSRVVDHDVLAIAGVVATTARIALTHAQALDDGRKLASRLQALTTLQRALGSGILDDTFQTFAARLAAEVSFDQAFVGSIANDQLDIAAVYPPESEAPSAREQLQLSDTPLSVLLRSAHARSAGTSFLTSSEAHGVARWASSIAVTPLVAHDALVGVLVLLSRSSHLAANAILPDARWLLSAIAEPLAMALQNSGLFARLRNNMRDWQTTFDVMDALVFIADEQGIVRRANWSIARRLNTSPSTLIGRPVHSLFPGQALPTASETPRATLTGPKGEPLRASAVALPGGGGTVFVMHEARSFASSSSSTSNSQSFGALKRISTGTQPIPARGRVLIVDDEPSILRAVTRALARYHDVTTASDGDEALELVRNAGGQFDAVMSDVQMARVGGLELYRAMEREFPAVAERFLFMTGGVFGGEIEQFLRGLKQRVLRKPFDPDMLRKAIDERVALSRVA
ncbi:MAG: hypothetical protein NVS3B20_05110 [Polyangiales bacterium]